VDNIREEILDKVPYPPTQLKKKIYVIDEVHMLSK
jgi:DNA polymerase III gamma/tau subunit